MIVFFCAIIGNKIPHESIFENERVLVIRDRAPKARIHYLILPKAHVKDLQSIQPKDMHIATDIFSTAQKLHRLVGNSDFNLVINSGYNAGQRVFHLHAHFLVDYQGDTL